MKDDDKFKFPEPEVFPEMPVTQRMLSGLHGTQGKDKLWKSVRDMLNKHYPQHFEGVTYTDEFIKDRGIHYYVTIAADLYLLERSLVHAHCDQARLQGKKFTLTLPDDPRTISKNHVSVFGGHDTHKKP